MVGLEWIGRLLAFFGSRLFSLVQDGVDALRDFVDTAVDFWHERTNRERMFLTAGASALALLGITAAFVSVLSGQTGSRPVSAAPAQPPFSTAAPDAAPAAPGDARQLDQSLPAHIPLAIPAHAGRLARASIPSTDGVLEDAIRQRLESQPLLQHSFMDAEPKLNGVRSAGRIAILIDDVGHNVTSLRRLLDIDADLSFAVLPRLQKSRQAALAISAAGREVLLHLPMEPHGYPKVDPGVGALLRSMRPQTLEMHFLEGLRDVPMLVGINNHMGSRFTEDVRSMRHVLKFIKRQGLFFVDSQTSPDSVAYREARRLGLRTAKRQVFLDHETDYAGTLRQIEELARLAERRGAALGIGHPHPSTIKALEDALPSLKRRGLQIVRVSSIVE